MRGIKKLLRIPLEIHPYEGVDDRLDVSYGAPIPTTCYAESEIKVVNDTSGKEVVSNTTIYLDGSEVISENDKILYNDKEHLIKALADVRELNGDIALWMVYV